MAKPSLSFFIMNFILLFVGISFILVVFDLHRFAFVFELGILLILMFFFAFGMFAAYHNKKWGWTLIGANFILLLVNLFFVFLVTGMFNTEHLTTLFFSVIGLAVSILNLYGNPSPEESVIDSYEKEVNYYPYIDKMDSQTGKEKQSEELKQDIKAEIKKELKEESEAKNEQGAITQEMKTPKKIVNAPKFVASKDTDKYHMVKCNWARMMKRKNKVFFSSKRKAEAMGFAAHECVA